MTNAFVTQTLPLIDHEALGLNVYVITSTELFDLLPLDERARIFLEEDQQEASERGGRQTMRGAIEVINPAWAQMRKNGCCPPPSRWTRPWFPMAWSRAAMCPSGALNAPYDEPAPIWAPNALTPESIAIMASSQIPPMASWRAFGFVRRL